MKWVKRLLLGAVVLFLPLVVLAGAVNLTARMPDFYQFEFNRDETPAKLELNVKSDELAAFFSKFMLGRAEGFDFIIVNENTEEEESLFPPEERATMEAFRGKMNLVSLAASVLLLPVVAAYFLFIRRGEKAMLRRAFKVSVVFFVAYAALCYAGLWVPSLSDFLLQTWMGGPFSEEGLLRQIFTREFVLHGAVLSAGIGVIAYIILGMITWSLTKPYRMFGRRDRGRA